MGNGSRHKDDNADEISILVATDNHVGYLERDAIRGEDSSRTFDEIIRIAKDRDVDMILLAGDLFHDNKPSRKAMYDVMKTLRRNCLGDKPCQLEILSDASENFSGPFNHANYEDPDINVAIPVFTIHGNHDDPSGEGSYSALDILAVSGLVNYYGKTPQSDKIEIKPVLLQKGRTKLALYGMSNVRDERLFRTFRDGNVKFFQPGDLPGVKKSDWFNLMSVHQNHSAHSSTGYLPENFLPEFLDLVVWGHEHECIVDPQYNPEMGFHILQPGSSVATSLIEGESAQKHVFLLKITGKDFNLEPIMLKTVRPFVQKDVVLAEEKALKGVWRKEENRSIVSHLLQDIVNEMIREGWDQYLEQHDGEMPDKDSQEEIAGRPLIRLRVEYSAPDGGRFQPDNPQRFSNKFAGVVANGSDVVSFFRKKTANRSKKVDAVVPEESTIAQITMDSIKVDKLVKEYLASQSLTILPQNTFSDAVGQFVDKDDKHAMETFVIESLANQMKHLLDLSPEDVEGEQAIAEEMDKYRAQLEALFASGVIKKTKHSKLKPKPELWDSDLDGHWEDQAGALVRSEDEDEDEEESNLGSIPPRPARGRGGGRVRGGRGAAAASTRKTAATKATSSRSTRGKKKVVEEDDEQESDVLMLDDEDEEDEDQLFVRDTRFTSKNAATTRSTASSRAGKAPAKTPATKQSTLNFSQAPSQATKTNGTKKKTIELSDDEISDDDDAFEPVSTAKTKTRR